MLDESPVPVRSRPSAVKKIDEPPKNCVSKRNRSKLTSRPDRYSVFELCLIVGRLQAAPAARPRAGRARRCLRRRAANSLPRSGSRRTASCRRCFQQGEPGLQSTHSISSVRDRVVRRHRRAVGIVRIVHPRLRVDVDAVVARHVAGGDRFLIDDLIDFDVGLSAVVRRGCSR